MKLQLLGTGGYHPNERRHTACLFLPEVGIVLDAGTSAFRLQERLVTNQLDLFITHAHLDHISGLTYLLVPMLSEKIQTARVHADCKTIDAIKKHLFSDPIFPVLPEFEFVELKDGQSVALPENGKLTHQPLTHPGGSRGFRLDWENHSLAYITDTTVDDSYKEWIQGVDVLVHECYFCDEMSEWAPKTGHSHTTPVAKLAKDAKVGKLILTHIDPQRSDDDPIGIEVAKKIFPNTILGEDLMEITF